jgi:hypothetical protein
VDCDVTPRPERAPFVVRAGDVAVTVVGTAFRVERADGEVTVSVTRGKVRVDSGGGAVELSAGKTWSGPATGAVVALADVRDSDTDGRAAGDGAARDGAARDGERADSSDSDHSGDADDEGDGGDGLIESKVRTRATTGDVHLRKHRATRPPVSGAGRDSRSGRNGAAGGDRRAKAKALAKPRRGAPPDQADDGALAEIMALEARDPRQAVRRYRALSLQRGPQAEFALYSMAFVQHFRLRQPQAALKSLHHYERRFPRGDHADAALWLRIRILYESDDHKACRAAAHTYLRKYPNGDHAEAADRIVHWDM